MNITKKNKSASHPPADSQHISSPRKNHWKIDVTFETGQSEAKRAAGTRTPWTWVGHHGSWTLMDLEFAWFLGPWLKWRFCRLRLKSWLGLAVCTMKNWRFRMVGCFVSRGCFLGFFGEVLSWQRCRSVSYISWQFMATSAELTPNWRVSAKGIFPKMAVQHSGEGFIV